MDRHGREFELSGEVDGAPESIENERKKREVAILQRDPAVKIDRVIEDIDGSGDVDNDEKKRLKNFRKGDEV